MTVDQARALVNVVELGGYAKAADKLGKSHSALVYLIRSLEGHCGFRIFEPKTYRSTLTPEGRRVWLKCQEILAKVDELDQMCGLFADKWEASLKVVLDGILPFDPFLKIYQDFRKMKVPTVVQTYTDFLQDVEKTFVGMEADMLISILPIRASGIETVELSPFKSLLVAHRDHPVHQSAKRWHVDELHEFSFLTIRGSRSQLGLSTAEFEESASFFFSDFASKKVAIQKKVGFGWLPEHMIETELRNRVLQPIKWERRSVHEIRPVLGVRRSSQGGRAAQLVVEALKQI
ncbi:MAG: LysR family transcriptional regulator [Bdellovibrionaceae bacterium]|nr:LysR family transcriptional regulator [Pseudobdellovibrionaceae bacterium]